jgi:hypothetical protein
MTTTRTAEAPLLDVILPPEFLERWRELEAERGRRVEIVATLVRQVGRRWTILALVEGRSTVVCHRSCLRTAANDLWSMGTR